MIVLNVLTREDMDHHVREIYGNDNPSQGQVARRLDLCRAIEVAVLQKLREEAAVFRNAGDPAIEGLEKREQQQQP